MLTRYQVVDSTAGNSDLAQHSLRVCGVPATTRTLLVSRLEELHCSVLSRTLINVCWPVATRDPPTSPWTPTTSSWHTVSVRPTFTTVPTASMWSPTAGANRLSVYSTVSTD